MDRSLTFCLNLLLTSLFYFESLPDINSLDISKIACFAILLAPTWSPNYEFTAHRFKRVSSRFEVVREIALVRYSFANLRFPRFFQQHPRWLNNMTSWAFWFCEPYFEISSSAYSNIFLAIFVFLFFNNLIAWSLNNFTTLVRNFWNYFLAGVLSSSVSCGYSESSMDMIVLNATGYLFLFSNGFY